MKKKIVQIVIDGEDQGIYTCPDSYEDEDIESTVKKIDNSIDNIHDLPDALVKEGFERMQVTEIYI